MSVRPVTHVLEPFRMPHAAQDCFSPRHLFDRYGALLLAKGRLITPHVRDLLQREEVYILSVPWWEWDCCVFSERLYWDTIAKLRKLYACTASVNGEKLNATIALVDELLDGFSGESQVYFDFKARRSCGDNTYIHSLNVAILSALIGREMGVDKAGLRQLTLGALLHDIGVLAIPGEIVHKAGGLSDEEYAMLCRHPAIGRDMLKQAILPWEVLAPVYQHHERWDGSGYPRGLRREDIHVNARITAVADVFDAAAADCQHRDGLPASQAFDLVESGGGGEFDPEVVAAFARAVALYPRNSTVKLNSGETGVVIAVPDLRPTRPQVQLLFNAHGQPVQERLVVDLRERPDSFIVAVETDSPGPAGCAESKAKPRTGVKK